MKWRWSNAHNCSSQLECFLEELTNGSSSPQWWYWWCSSLTPSLPESMNFLRALTWKSRRPSHLHQINTISLFPVWATGKTSDSLRSRWVAASSRGPGLLCAPRDAPAELQPLPHRARLCCLGHHPPGASPHWTPSAAGRPWRLPRAGDGRGRPCPGKYGPHTGFEEVLSGHPCLPERERTQWLGWETVRMEITRRFLC